MGANPGLIEASADVQDAIARSLVPHGIDPAPAMRLPGTWDEAYDEETAPFSELMSWWVDRMVASESPIHERLTWFWHDHFATSGRKADVAWGLWKQLETIRSHASGNFADLLKAIARDPAMLVYLDGESNSVWEINENFGREVMELHTLGIGNYSQSDVVAAAHCCTGWQVNYPADEGKGWSDADAEGWSAVFAPEAFDDGPKTLLGRTGKFGLDEALDIMLEHPATGPFVASKLFRELVGFWPDDATATRLGGEFAETYEIMPLVEAIVAEPAFVSDDAINAKVRTPLEKLVTLFQSFERDPEIGREDLVWGMQEIGYIPFAPPNPAGYPRGQSLLGPSSLAGAFLMLTALAEPTDRLGVRDLYARFGLYDVSLHSRNVVERQSSPGAALALVFGSPEFALT